LCHGLGDEERKSWAQSKVNSQLPFTCDRMINAYKIISTLCVVASIYKAYNTWRPKKDYFVASLNPVTFSACSELNNTWN
jgi:hypothetical protein